MRGRERRHDQDERSQTAERNDQTDEKQQMIGAVEDMEEAELHEAQCRLVPARIELDESWIAGELERALGPTRRDEADRGRHPQAEPCELRLDRKMRAVGANGIVKHR